MSIIEPLPAVRCPLCGGPNGCGPAASGSFATGCWCEAASFSRELLDSVPPSSRGRACVCRLCAAEVLAPSSAQGRSAVDWDGD